MVFTQRELDGLDHRRGIHVLTAIAYAGKISSTFSAPATFVCDDGNIYWVKNNVQQGLCVELIAGRLGSLLRVAPSAQVIRVSPAALPSGMRAELIGDVLGSQDVPDAINARDIGDFVAKGGVFDADLVDRRSLSRVITFQTWIGVSDRQVLVRPTDGMVFSIDHGDCFGATSALADPTMVVTSIPGVDETRAKDAAAAMSMVEKIEQVTNAEILRAVAGVPTGAGWGSEPSRRLEIAEWLAYRRGTLRGTIASWLNS